MPRMAPAWLRASAGSAASRMPPALPRLPVGTCAFTTQGPISRAAASASAAFDARRASGTSILAAASSGLAAFSSKFTAPPSLAVLRPVAAEQLLLARLVLRDGGDEMGDVDEVAPVEVLRDRVLGPGAATHREGERHGVVEGTAVADGVRLVHQHTHQVDLAGRRGAMLHVGGVERRGEGR